MHTYTFTDTHTYLQKRSFFDLLKLIHRQHHFFSSVDFLCRGNAHDEARRAAVKFHTSISIHVRIDNGQTGGQYQETGITHT